MPKLSELLNADVINKTDPSLLGEVSDVYFDENCKNIVYFVITRAEGKALLPFSAAACVADAVMTDGVPPLRSAEGADLVGLLSEVTGKKVYSCAGRAKGRIKDVIFSSNGRVRTVVVENAEYSPSSFGAFGDVWLLKERACAKKASEIPFPKAKTNYKVTVLAEKNRDSREDLPQSPARVNVVTPAASSGSTLPVRAAEEEEMPVYLRDAAGAPEVVFGDEGFTPYRVIADYNFLLGRTLTDDIFAYTGEKLASKGQRVTADTVEEARKHGKLMDLTLSSR